MYFLRNKMVEMKLVIIDELSMVSNLLFFQMNQRLQVFAGSYNKPFKRLLFLMLGSNSLVYAYKSSMRAFLSLDLKLRMKKF